MEDEDAERENKIKIMIKENEEEKEIWWKERCERRMNKAQRKS